MTVLKLTWKTVQFFLRRTKTLTSTSTIQQNCNNSANSVEKNKVSIIGAGNVGQALAGILILQRVTNNIAIVSQDCQKLDKLLSNLQQISCGHSIEGSDDYSVINGSQICVITTTTKKVQKSRLESLQSNVEAFKKYMPKIATHAPNSILIVVTNPVDALTYVAAELTGFPKDRVFGSGTHLDSTRLRFFISQKFGVGIECCDGWVIGEHGATAVTAYSTCSVGSAYVSDYNQKMGLDGDVDNWGTTHKEILKSGLKLVGLKGYTNWAVAFCLSGMIRSILNNCRSAFAVTIIAEGLYGIKEKVYLSLPVILGEKGVEDTITLSLNEDECAKLQKSADFLYNLQKQINL